MKKEIELFKKKIRGIGKPLNIITIGSSHNQEDTPDMGRDIDIIIVVEDETDCYEYVKKLSPVIKDFIVRGVNINAYPIKESIYRNGESEFLQNVRKVER